MRLYSEMLGKADTSQVPGLSRFFKTGPGQYGEGDKFLGIKVPVTREVVKQCWRETSLTDAERRNKKSRQTARFYRALLGNSVLNFAPHAPMYLFPNSPSSPAK